MAGRYDPRPQHEQNPDGVDAMAHALAWFGIGLGLVELLAPRSVGRFLGMEEHSVLIQAYGVREIASGALILCREDQQPGIWSRVAGDVVDLATLAPGLRADNNRRENVALAMAAVAGVTALDLLCGKLLVDRQTVVVEAEYPARRSYASQDREGYFPR